MNNSKKIKTIIISIMIISILTSCGNKVETLEDFNAEEKLEPVELTFYLYGNEPANNDEVLHKIEKQCGLNVKLNFKWFQQDYNIKLEQALAANEQLDAFILQGSYQMLTLFYEDKLKDISNLFPQYAPTIYNKLTKEDINVHKINGKLVSVPSLCASVEEMMVSANPQLVQKYDIKEVNTLDEYENLLKLIKENEKNYFPAKLAKWDIGDIIGQVILQYGYILLDNQLQLAYKLDDPEMKLIPVEKIKEVNKICSKLNDWVKKGYATFEDNQKDEFATYIMMYDKNDSYGMFELYPESTDIKNAYYFGSNLLFNNNSNNVDRALMFLDWIQSSQENYDLFNYGIKDKNYKLNGEKIIYINDGYYWLNTAFKNPEYIRLYEGMNFETNEFRKSIQENIKKARYAPHEGFYIDNENIRSEINNRQLFLQSYIYEQIFKGTYDSSKINTIIEKLKKGGTDKVVVEVQKQLDNWRKNKQS